MTTPARTITDQNFVVFKALLSEVHQKTHGKPMQLLSEKAAEDLVQIIEDTTGKSITGKTLQKFTRAAIVGSPETVNPKLYTLHCLAEFVMFGNGSTGKENPDYPHWYYYQRRFLEKEHMPTSSHSLESPAAKATVILAPLSKRELIEYCITGGLIAGTINTLLVIFLPGILNGYHDLAGGNLVRLVPLITIGNIGGAIFFAAFCGFLACLPEGRINSPAISLREKMLIVIVSFVFIAFFKQMASRPNPITGRNWGYFDLETLSLISVSVIGIFCLVALLRKPGFYSLFELGKLSAIVAFKAIFPMIIIYFIFKFFIEGTQLHRMKFPSESVSIFNLHFPHPERILLILIMSFCAVFCVMYTINSGQKRSSS